MSILGDEANERRHDWCVATTIAKIRYQLTMFSSKYATPIKLTTCTKMATPMHHRNNCVRFGCCRDSLRVRPESENAATTIQMKRSIVNSPPRTPSVMNWFVVSPAQTPHLDTSLAPKSHQSLKFAIVRSIRFARCQPVDPERTSSLAKINHTGSFITAWSSTIPATIAQRTARRWDLILHIPSPTNAAK